jgi:hypothetical protein
MGGFEEQTILARCDDHAEWIEWHAASFSDKH